MENHETYFNEGYAQINLHENAKTIEIIFKDADINHSQYQLVLSKSLVQFKQSDYENWLIDIGTKNEISDNEKRWAEEYLIPDLIESGIRKIAFVISVGDFSHEQKEILKNMVEIRKGIGHFFNSKAEAFVWLTGK